jgi:hypothetical protein
MQELRRQRYLAALGIDSYMPLMQFDMAPAPVLCELPLATDTIDTSFNGTIIVDDGLENSLADSPLSLVVLEQTAQAIDKVFKSLVETPAPAEIKNSPALVQPEKVVANNRPAVTFSLSMWYSHDDWLVIDSRKPQAALPTSALLNNIIPALWQKPLRKGVEEVWHWPFAGNSFSHQTEEDAKDALSVWIEVAHEQRSVNRLLVMGEVAWRYIGIPSTTYEESLWQHYPLANGVTAWVVPSLVELLENPHSKKKLWQRLRVSTHE